MILFNEQLGSKKKRLQQAIWPTVWVVWIQAASIYTQSFLEFTTVDEFVSISKQIIMTSLSSKNKLDFLHRELL